MKPTKLVTLASLAVLAALALPAAAEDKWSFDIAPYLWVASVGGDVSVPQNGAVTPGSLRPESSLSQNGAGTFSSVQEFDTRISGGFMIAAQARYGSVGLLGDFNWVQLDTESVNPGTLYSGVDMKSDFFYTTAAVTYTLPLQGKFHAEVLAGAGIWHVATDFELRSGLLPSSESSNSKTWVNPLFGVNLRYDLTKHWLLLARGTAGGFIDSNVQVDLFAGVGYQFTDWCMATLGYRYLHEEFSQDDFTFDVHANGFLLGVGFHF